MNEIFRVAGKTAIITGGSGVLGSNIARGLLQAGARVFIIGSRQETVQKALDELKPFGRVAGSACNVLDIEELKRVREDVLHLWGTIDIWVNPAGGNIPGGTLTADQTFFDMKVEDFDQVVDLNLTFTVYPCMAVVEVMAKQYQVSIVTVTSMAATPALSRVRGYSVAKSGIEIFTKWLATEMALKFGHKVRVNAIAPGFFIGNQNRAILINPDGSLTERSQKVIAKTPMR